MPLIDTFPQRLREELEVAWEVRTGRARAARPCLHGVTCKGWGSCQGGRGLPCCMPSALPLND